MRSSAVTCPVPLEQQPIEEYRLLRESRFFNWATLAWRPYSLKIFWVWSWSWLISGPVAAASFSPSKHLLHFLLAGTAGAALLTSLVLLRLYLGWTYIQSRLLSLTVFYEESGWYDGQTWPKPAEAIARDRLIVAYEVKPIVQRLHRTFAILMGLLFMGTLLWYCL